MSDAPRPPAPAERVGEVIVLAVDRLTPEFVRRPLEPLGLRVTAAPDAATLLAAMAAAPPRAVVVPRRLPGTDVAALLDAVKAAAPDTATVLLGLGEGDRARARALGADGFLAVPFSDVEVRQVLGVRARERMLILLADDSPLIHKHTVPILAEAGYEVVSAHDGAEGLELATARRPDLIITDVEMPRMDGFTLCKALKSSPETSHVPVIICSALGEAADLERGFDSGADDYLVKPVLPEELSTRVRQMLAGSMAASRERILVVDDSPAQRHYVQDCLARQGFEIVTAENGRQGLERARATRPALIVSDYDMPEMTGFEMVHALKRDPELRHTPVVMLTARDTRRDVAQMRAAGATAYLVKPFAQDKCIATVERTLAERRLFAYKEASRLYISDGAARAAEERAAAGDLAGEGVRADERVMSVLFSDVCGFTPLSEKLSPRQVIELLNAYFDVLCPIIKAEGGDIDKFIGDAIMAVFDDLPGREPPPARAIRAALAMQASMPAFNEGRPIPVTMRIGINTGPLVRGDLGSRFHRRDYTVIGDTVNRAQRFESSCPRGGVLASQSTVDALPGWLATEPLSGLKLKGVAEPVNGFVVKSIRPKTEEP